MGEILYVNTHGLIQFSMYMYLKWTCQFLCLTCHIWYTYDLVGLVVKTWTKWNKTDRNFWRYRYIFIWKLTFLYFSNNRFVCVWSIGPILYITNDRVCFYCAYNVNLKFWNGTPRFQLLNRRQSCFERNLQ